jgi:small subunit ribosomal protein S12
MITKKRLRKAKILRSKCKTTTKTLLVGPHRKGVVEKLVILKPKKPNSARRKACLVTTSNGDKAYCYIPGEGHTLQVNSSVLIKGGRVPDLPGVKYKLVRGKYDLAGVKGRKSSKSKYSSS